MINNPTLPLFGRVKPPLNVKIKGAHMPRSGDRRSKAPQPSP
jgi:hypothetical protein